MCLGWRWVLFYVGPLWMLRELGVVIPIEDVIGATPRMKGERKELSLHGAVQQIIECKLTA